jgi:HEPN domain-containing protein
MVEFHPRLSERYMDEVEEFLRKKDYTQASEKAWETASQAVKALAARRGRDIGSHRELHEFVAVVSEELKDREIGRLWRSTTSLHQNFYENWFAESQVVDGVEDMKRLVEKLKQLVK